MKYITFTFVIFLFSLFSTSVLAELTMEVSMQIDAEELEVGESTTVHVYGLVDEGVTGQDGIFSFCMNVTFDVQGVFEVVPDTIVHPNASNFDEPMSSLGIISADGLTESYDMYFFDDTYSLGIGSPIELLRFDITAVTAGTCNLQSSAADTDGNHVSDGTVTGFLLFSGSDHLVIYEDSTRVISGITTGACCVDTSCIELTPADCFTTGGSYLGDDVLCGVGSCAPPCPADLNGNGEVDIDDLLSFIGAWGPCDVPCPADFDGNGEIGIDDLLILISAWGPC